jgi:hypothetical protein
MDTSKLVNIVVDCPHCKEPILIEQLNCCIFRHGIFKNNMLQIDPHTPKNLCEHYIEHQLIIGCGNPFKVILNDNSKNEDDKCIAVVCDYI